MDSEKLTYETKCRRCGSISEWFFAYSEQVGYLKFVSAMNDYVINPRDNYCKVCKKTTVQDLVSWAPQPNESVHEDITGKPD